MRKVPFSKRISFAFPLIALLGMAACISKTEDQKAINTIPPAAGGSGAFGIVTVNGHQKMYLPLQIGTTSPNAQIAVVDVGVAGSGITGAPALLKLIDLGTADVATATGGDTSVVVAASTLNAKIRFIDPQTDTLVTSIDLDPSFGTSGFSGGGGYVTGVAIDSANHRAILSTWNGFTLVDTQTHAVTSTIQAAPSENFGFDSIHQKIVAPFYDCSSAQNTSGPLSLCGNYKGPTGNPMVEGLNVIDLADGTVYTYMDPTLNTTSANADSPVGSEPDSAAIDPTNQIAVVPSEGNGYQNVLDLSQAKFDKNAKTFTAPNHLIQNAGLTGVAIEPNKHFGFWEEEHSSQIGVADVVAANTGGATFVSAEMPLLPGSTSWSNMGDPHGIAVTTGINSGNAVGFVVSSDLHWVARVDLQKVLDLHTAAGASTAALDISAAVTFLDAQTAIPAAK
jgi:hypothetical protein